MEALIIGGAILLIFGAKKLPELAKSMGQSKAAFDEGLKEGMSSDDAEKLKEANELFDRGVITEKEFQEIKDKYLD